MKIIVGSARIDENGKIQGGAKGDQTGKEVATQAFYIHSKGWFVLRPKSADVAKNIAKGMLIACNNEKIGYNQNERLGVIKLGINTNEPTNCDCSTLIRACIIYASGKDPGNFTTFNECDVLEKSGLFERHFAYNNDTVLYEGDVLVTKTKGHTVAVTNGNVREIVSDAPIIPKVNKNQAEFLSLIVPLVQKQVLLHGNKLYASVTIAQAAHESGWGTSKKMVSANALFGFKVGSGKKYGKAWHGAAFKSGTTEYYDGKTATKITDYFRQYDTIEDSICDYMDLLCNNPRYGGAIFAGSPRQSIEGIVSGGYATGPKYVDSIINIISQYNLLKYDKEVYSNVCPYAETNATLSRGMKGEKVKYLQWILREKYHHILQVDGLFGPTTEYIVKSFQASHDLEVDGVVGPKTWKELKNGS
ncbi:MAG: glucosaminidase domain-containing protein [Clostridiales bacterium]|nr:glucosaminidase domain-containing protein [Clostridiales bacterium]